MQQRQSLASAAGFVAQLQQSLLILQTPLLELRNLVQQEMQTNPVLEELPEDPGANERGEVEASGDEISRMNSRSWRVWTRNGAITWRSRQLRLRWPAGSTGADDKRQFLFDSIPVHETLQQNLVAQLNQTVVEAGERKTAELIIGNIDDDGFLQRYTGGNVPELWNSTGRL